MTRFTPNLTPGYLARHAPAKSTKDREAALIDVAQDLLLRELAEVSVLSALAFRGGTAIRKVHAGASGRFSIDLDFPTARNALEQKPTGLDSGALDLEAIPNATLRPLQSSRRRLYR